MFDAVSAPLGDAALVIAAHGASRCPLEEEPAFRQAEALRKRSLFSRVEAGFWKREPDLKTIVANCAAPRVFIVPFFISGGYFAEKIIPAALGFHLELRREDSRIQLKGRQRLHYCHAIGSHPTMAGVIVARAREAMCSRASALKPGNRQGEPAKNVTAKFHQPLSVQIGHASESSIALGDCPAQYSSLPSLAETALVIAGHGTEKHDSSKEAILDQARRIGDLQLFAEVRAAFLEEAPRIDRILALIEASEVVVVPFFIGEGGHVMEDIPIMLGAKAEEVQNRLREGLPAWQNPGEINDKRIWYAEAVGGEPLLADVILARVLESAQPIP